MAKIEHINFGHKQLKPKVPKPVLPPFSLHEIQNILQEMAELGDTCALATIVSPFNQDYETFEVVPDDLETSTEDKSFMEIIKEIMSSNDFLNNMEFDELLLSNEYFAKNLKLTVDSSSKLCLDTIKQNNDHWLQERRQRITASRCYNLFTYNSNKKPDWGKKIKSFLNPKKSYFVRNMQYGVENESLARECYIQQSGNEVTNVGFFCPSKNLLVGLQS